MQAVRIQEAPTIDGKLDDSAWKSAATLESFIDPQTGRAPDDGTAVWLAYDEEAIYVAFHARDGRPESIVAREIQPNARFQGEDTFEVVIDPFYTRERNWSRFRINALGTQAEDIAGGRAAKREWRGQWQAAAQRLADGWSGEMRIPWRILSIPSAERPIEVGINFNRYQARTRVFSQWSNLTPAGRAELIGVWKGVELPKLPWKPRVEWLAYTAPEVDGRRHELRSGLDARYRFTEKLTALASLNPDFRNIEQDIAGIEFTRSERFLDDARPFFTEGAGFFDLTGPFTFGRMFYSRRIESFDWGGKLFGRLSRDASVGALATVESREQVDAVARLGYSRGSDLSLSGYATHRARPGFDSGGHGLNIWRRWGNYSGDVQLATNPQTGRRDRSAGGFSASYSVPHYFAIVRHTWIEPEFGPALAYIPFQNRRGTYLYTEYNKDWRRGTVRELHADLFLTSYDHYDGSNDERSVNIGGSVELSNDMDLGVWYNRGLFGEEIHDTVFGEIEFNASNRYRRFGFAAESGRRGDLPTRYLSAFGTYRAFGKIDLSLAQSVLELGGVDRQTVLTIGWEIDRLRSLTGRVVETNGRRNAYLAFRSAGLAGLEIFVIAGDPNSETFRRRLSLKLVSAF